MSGGGPPRRTTYAYHPRHGQGSVPFSRLFILLGVQNVPESGIIEAFKPFGNIRNIKKITKQETNKEWCFIGFSKCSEAFLAMEQMNGKTLPGSPKPLKILLANEKSDEFERETEKPLDTILIQITNEQTSDIIKEIFQAYGSITSCRVIKRKDGKEGPQRKICFVTFERPYSAALALEQCDFCYKPTFSIGTPQRKRDRNWGGQENVYAFDRYQNPEDVWKFNPGKKKKVPTVPPHHAHPAMYHDYHHGPYHGPHGPPGPPGPPPMSSMGRGPSPGRSLLGHAPGIPSLVPGYYDGFEQYDDYDYHEPAGRQSLPDFRTGPPGYGKSGKLALKIQLPTMETPKEQVQKLFDIIPGMVTFEGEGVIYHVTFDSPNWAHYAKEKLNQFEYPPGHKLAVEFDDSPSTEAVMSSVIQQLASAAQDPSNLNSLVATLQKAASALKVSGSPPSKIPTSTDMVRYCDFLLPPRQPYAAPGSEMAMKVFVHAKPSAIPLQMAEDLFIRFGELISVDWIEGKNFGFVKYAAEANGRRAIETLHDKTIGGKALTVKLSEHVKKNTEKEEGKQSSLIQETA